MEIEIGGTTRQAHSARCRKRLESMRKEENIQAAERRGYSHSARVSEKEQLKTNRTNWHKQAKTIISRTQTGKHNTKKEQ